VLQLADVRLDEERCVVAITPSPTASADDIERALTTLRRDGDRVIALMPWADARSMRVRLVDAGRSASPLEDAACAVAIVLGGWSWDEREVIPVDVDGRVIAVSVVYDGTVWRCGVE
jgi:hypothetical protein